MVASVLTTLNADHELLEVREANLSSSISLNEQNPVNADLIDEGKGDFVTLVEIDRIQGLEDKISLLTFQLDFHDGIIVDTALRIKSSLLLLRGLGEGLFEYLLKILDLSDRVLELVLGVLEKEPRVKVVSLHSLSEERLETVDLLLEEGFGLFDSLFSLDFLLVLGIISNTARRRHLNDVFLSFEDALEVKKPNVIIDEDDLLL